jgi:hypothetical protein
MRSIQNLGYLYALRALEKISIVNRLTSPETGELAVPENKPRQFSISRSYCREGNAETAPTILAFILDWLLSTLKIMQTTYRESLISRF